MGAKRKRSKSSGGQKKRRTTSKAQAAKGVGKKRGPKRAEGPSVSAVEQWERDLVQFAKLEESQVRALCGAVFATFQDSGRALPWKIEWSAVAKRVSQGSEQAWTGDRCKRSWRVLCSSHVFPTCSEQAVALNKLRVDEYLCADNPLAQLFPPGWDALSKEQCLEVLERQKRERDKAAKQRQQQLKMETLRAAEMSRQANSSAMDINALQQQQQQQMLLLQAQAQAQVQAQQQQQQRSSGASAVAFPSTDAGFALWAAETKQKVIEQALHKIRQEIPNLNNQEDAKRAEERASQVHQKLWLEWLAEPEAQRQTYIVRSAMHSPGMLQAFTDQQKVQLLQKQQQEMMLLQQTLQQQQQQQQPTQAFQLGLQLTAPTLGVMSTGLAGAAPGAASAPSQSVTVPIAVAPTAEEKAKTGDAAEEEKKGVVVADSGVKLEPVEKGDSKVEAEGVKIEPNTQVQQQAKSEAKAEEVKVEAKQDVSGEVGQTGDKGTVDSTKPGEEEPGAAPIKEPEVSVSQEGSGSG